MREPTYLRMLLEHAKSLPRGKVHHVEIRHDDDCGIFADRPCDCEPELESGARVDRKYSEAAK